MQQPTNTSPVQVVVLAQPGIRDKQSVYKNMKVGLARQLIGLGMLHLLIGILCIILQGISLGIHADYITLYFIGYGFWTGLLFLITGPFGVAGGITRNRCQVVTFNVFSVVSAVFALFLIGIAAGDAFLYGIGQRYCDYYYNYYTSGRYDCYFKGKTGTALEATMAILGLMECIIAIWSSAICCTIGACCCRCGGSCCCPPSPAQNQLISNQPPTFLPNTQQQTIINLDLVQQMVQHRSTPQHPNSPSNSQQTTDDRTFSPDPNDQGLYNGLYAGKRDTIMAPERPAIRWDRTSTYDNIPHYDRIENDDN